MPRSAIRSILVATDLSQGSHDVVRAAAELAAQTGAELHAIHAVEVHGSPFWESGFDLVRLQGVVQDTRSALGAQLEGALPLHGFTTSEKLDFQTPPVAILRRAKEVAADLIVLGPHQPRIPGSYLLGTTAQRVVEEATVPCLVTRGSLRAPLQRILLPVGRADVERGLIGVASEWLATLRRQQEVSMESRFTTEVRVLHVVSSADAWRDFSADFAASIRSASAATDLAAYLRLRRAVAWSRSPAAEIVHVAEELDTDLIAMGVRGHGPLMRALLGSVSTHVLRRTSAPVLFFPSRLCERLSQGRAASPLGVRPADDESAVATVEAVR